MVDQLPQHTDRFPNETPDTKAFSGKKALGIPKARRSSSMGWRERLSQKMTLTLVISWTVIVAVLAVSLVAGQYALQVLTDNKLADTWAIMFLELERKGDDLSQKLEAVLATQNKSHGLLEIKRIGNKNQLTVLEGNFGLSPQLGDWHLDDFPEPDQWDPYTILEYAGQNYFGFMEETPTALQQSGTDASLSEKNQNPINPGENSGSVVRIRLKKIEPRVFRDVINPKSNDNVTVYIMNRGGSLIYKTKQNLSVTTVGASPLVRHFIKSPMRHGQLAFKNVAGQDSFGFFYEIPRSNLVLFSEVETTKVLATIDTMVRHYFAFLAATVIIALIVLQWPIFLMTRPLRQITASAYKIGGGDFSVTIPQGSFGELKVLGSAFSTMTKGLVARDASINKLMGEQVTKVRLEGELAIARKIQNNLLPKIQLPPNCGTSIAAAYFPASECAGDWYGVAHHPTHGETVVAIVDVAGHGAGSSMFTAMIAGLFDQCRAYGQKSFDLGAFATAANGVLYRLGAKEWHATMMIVKHIPKVSEAEILFAGHTPAYLRTEGPHEAVKAVTVGSQPLGLQEEFSLSRTRIPFPSGASLVLYTDGLTEALNTKGKRFGYRNLKKCIAGGPLRSPQRMVDHILAEWRRYIQGCPPNDDACVVVIKAS